MSSLRPRLLPFSFAVAFVLPLIVTLDIHAQEWTRFRGPNGSGIGHITGLPARLTKADYDWAVKLDGIGHSSPVVWGQKLFLTLLEKDGRHREIQCRDTRSGKLLWKWKTGLQKHNLHRYNDFASSTPTVDKDRVYAVWGSGTTTQAIALNHDGELQWRRQWPGFTSDHGFATSPVLIGGKLIFHTDALAEKKSYVIALNPETGESAWQFERVTKGGQDVKHITAYNTPIAVTSGGIETIVALQTNDGWKGLDPANGEVVWAYAGNYTLRTVGSFAESDGILFATFGSGGQGKNATALKMNGTPAPDVLYELGIKDGLSYVPTPLIYKDRLFIWGDGGVLCCRDLKTGKEIYRERVSGNFFSSPIFADGKIYCASRDGELVCVAAEGPFQILGRSRLESGVNATPAIANQRLFVRTDTHLFSVKGESKE